MSRERESRQTARITYITYSNLVRREQQKLRQLDDLVAAIQEEQDQKNALQSASSRVKRAIREKQQTVDRLLWQYCRKQKAKPPSEPPPQCSPSARDSRRKMDRDGTEDQFVRDRRDHSRGIGRYLRQPHGDMRNRRRSSPVVEDGSPLRPQQLSSSVAHKSRRTASRPADPSKASSGSLFTDTRRPDGPEDPRGEHADGNEYSQHNLSLSSGTLNTDNRRTIEANQSLHGSHRNIMRSPRRCSTKLADYGCQLENSWSAPPVTEPIKPSVWTRAQWYRNKHSRRAALIVLILLCGAGFLYFMSKYGWLNGLQKQSKPTCKLRYWLYR